MSVLCPPTTYLPPIAKIASFSATQLLDALTYLQSLYHPEVRGSRRKRAQVPMSNGEQNLRLRHEDDGQLELHAIRSDAFERSYSIRWLTTLIAQLEVWQDLSHSKKVSLDDLGIPGHSLAHTEMIVQQAASLLAICAGVAAAGMITRHFIFNSIDGQRRVEAQLTDIPLDNNDYGSVGAQTWGGACVLAEMIVDDPERFGLDSSHCTESRRLNVLELGAGTGLVSVVVMKLLDRLPSSNHREVHVVATDFHPSVLANLKSNVNANVPSTHNQITPTHSVTTHFLDWSSFSTAPRPDCLSYPFDVILGADIIYEAQHAVWIRDCLKGLMRRPSDSTISPAAFHLVIPLRSTHTFESSTVESVFLKACDADLVILSKEFIACDAYGDYPRGQGSIDEDVEYIYYKIGWFNARL
ncbi:putative methyltransferase-domain-containing protein [Suillus bovinus]|uniref:putative methyltransferase-domain-containing protein n=1 Tax=Suillus bovinus TaxID=48563 RepID=UPI001B879EBC|nr:putative methyltransferase-domain-containing protein [Suillus bovinus]KAG2134153.1 putative methyltransferase-domain-containing protein [Suillus bovinus]